MKKDANLMGNVEICTKARGRVGVSLHEIMYLMLLDTIERESVWLWLLGCCAVGG